MPPEKYEVARQLKSQDIFVIPYKTWFIEI